MATEQELQSLFNSLDRDQDGKVSLNEFFLSPGLTAIISSETNTNSPQELLVQYDLDEDGSITFEELKDAVEKANNLT
ncbi:MULTISPECIES: EF-hand domain-containing protein [unclassified Nodularia (in: cyanobacteria)]|uniref:EF-hand domain-containing protein n=1 Tax=unclassified Nodularia (in: cyanobacteria) TaxID=2656917 RepID=UPI0018830ED2|nr:MULTISPECIES: EF-hand domain-containing protein [unclassified Nodularia (in: cyanobacteria)]MBE9201747.1 EF-hand domain-containing protein [Nodularia sp. LEGE 06071]MCC2694959.1 EF-hand domain-containing protein [Nodularia sp. LEGE 04288]